MNFCNTINRLGYALDNTNGKPKTWVATKYGPRWMTREAGRWARPIDHPESQYHYVYHRRVNRVAAFVSLILLATLITEVAGIAATAAFFFGSAVAFVGSAIVVGIVLVVCDFFSGY